MNRAVAALLAGEPVILPTDTVYGLCASTSGPEPAARLYALKGRELSKPSALIAADLAALLACLPELHGRVEAVARALLPGPYTFVVPNPARRFPWLTGEAPAAIGVRVPDLPAPTRAVLDAVGCVVATSANLAGGPDPRCVEEIPSELRDRVGAVVDVGELPGTPSTVIDLTGAEPRVVREGAVSEHVALEQVAAALRTA